MTGELERHERRLREFLAREPFRLHPDKGQIAIFQRAFTHDSFTEEYNKKASVPLEPYERLEFLGDAVLEFLVCDSAYRIPQLDSEGALTNDFKQKAVSNARITGYLKDAGIDLDDHMLVGHSFSSKNGNVISDDMRSDVFEALIAAIYLTFGLECARSVVDRIILTPLKESQGYI
jgi:ribonuclease-3